MNLRRVNLRDIAFLPLSLFQELKFYHDLLPAAFIVRPSEPSGAQAGCVADRPGGQPRGRIIDIDFHDVKPGRGAGLRFVAPFAE
jgi:hypothetical protein